MVCTVEEFYKIIELIRRRIPFAIIMKPRVQVKSLNCEKEILLRTEIKDMSEAEVFIDAFEAVTHSNFNLISNKDVSSSSVSSRKWCCTHGVAIGSNKSCTATISMKTTHNGNNLQDIFLRKTPHVSTVIRINPNHNHPLMKALPQSKLQKINKDVKMCFYEYFKRGYFGQRAKWLHEQYLQKANFFAENDDSMNPTFQAIYTLANNWLKFKGSMKINEVSNTNSGFLEASFIKKENEIEQFPSQQMENVLSLDNVASKIKKEPSDEYSTTEDIVNEIMDIQPVLTIKQEIMDEDENTGLPVISSCSSLALSSAPPKKPVMKSTTVKKAEKLASNTVSAVVKMVRPSPSQVVVYDQPSNTYKVVKCVSVNDCTYSTSQYKSHLANTFVSTRMSLQRL